MVQNYDQLKGCSQQRGTAEITLQGKLCKVVVGWTPEEACSNLVELFHPRGKDPLTRSIVLGLLGNGDDCKLRVMRTRAAGHNPVEVGRLPTAIPCLVNLAAEVRADQGLDESLGDARRLTDPFCPPSGERSELGTGLISLANIELSEGADEPILDSSD